MGAMPLPRSAASRDLLLRDAPPILAFLVLGMYAGSWRGLLPVLAERIGATEPQLGAAIMASSLSGLIATPIVGRSCDRWGVRVLPLALAALAVTLPLVGAAWTVETFAIAMGLAGFCGTFVNVSMNTAVNALEDHGVHRAPMSHALFAAGALASSVGAGALLALHVGSVTTLLCVSVLLVAVMAYVAATNPHRAAPAHGEDRTANTDTSGLPIWTLRALGVLAGLGLLVEAATGTWCGIYLHESLGASVALAAMAPGAYSVGMVCSRVAMQFAPKAEQPYGVVAAGSFATTAALVLLVLVPSVWLALVACALAGASTGIVMPTLFVAASRLGGVARRGAALSIVTSFGWFGGLVGHGAVGVVAGRWSLTVAMLGVGGAAALLGALSLAMGARVAWPRIATRAAVAAR
jgi:predicted MFS family arabinose efflux permease